ncbi:MAG: ABC transporter ATP-binding protein [Proteobacteria bacterium]|nr:ABC transporter ATP-binding protein [Pseudomonadota bacterium]
MTNKLYGVDLHRTFVSESGGATHAIDNVTISIGAHEFVSLLGPSGCGKTTLLNLFAGFDHPTAGHVYLDGKEISAPGPDRGVVFQEHALFPWLRVEDNVGAGKRLQARPAQERREIVSRQLAMVGLEKFARHYPHQLSGGMKQRVSIARALANEPEVLLMDEPFAALDAMTRSQLQSELIRIWSETRKTIVFVTHNIEEAVLLSDRIAVMTARPGRIREIIEVDLPKPRDPNSPNFNAIERRVREILWEGVSSDLH